MMMVFNCPEKYGSSAESAGNLGRKQVAKPMIQGCF